MFRLPPHAPVRLLRVSTLLTLSSALGRYTQTKSALHFAPEHPLPAALVRKLLAARIAEIPPAQGRR